MKIYQRKFLDWAVWLMIIVVVVLFLLRIFGDSPTTEQLVIGLLGTFLVAIYRDLQGIKEKLGEHSAELKYLKEQSQRE